MPYTPEHNSRIELWFAAAILVALISIAVHVQPVNGQPQVPSYPIGSVLASRNADERENDSPGYWNHLAIVVSDTEVVESQPEQGVVRVTLSDYLNRGYKIAALQPRHLEVGKKAAEYAESFVGQSYGYFASIGPLWRCGRKNCVAVVERSYRMATKDWPLLGVWKPDDVFKPRICSP